jgi:hypothetical protein
MDGAFNRALDEIEEACAGIQAALLAEDWQAVSVANEDLNSRLERFAALLDEPALSSDSNSIELAAARLACVLEQHARLAQQLIAARDIAGDELAGLHRGRRVADHYFDTASATA